MTITTSFNGINWIVTNGKWCVEAYSEQVAIDDLEEFLSRQRNND